MCYAVSSMYIMFHPRLIQNFDFEVIEKLRYVLCSTVHKI